MLFVVVFPFCVDSCVILCEQGVEGYQSFLKDTDKVPACETLCIESWTNPHAFAPTMLHLLGRWRCTRKLKLYVDQVTYKYKNIFGHVITVQISSALNLFIKTTLKVPA